jgi:hypothetical protein
VPSTPEWEEKWKVQGDVNGGGGLNRPNCEEDSLRLRRDVRKWDRCVGRERQGAVN